MNKLRQEGTNDQRTNKKVQTNEQMNEKQQTNKHEGITEQIN